MEKEIRDMKETERLQAIRILELEKREKKKEENEDMVIPLSKVPLVYYKGTANELDSWMLFLNMNIMKYTSTLSSDLSKINWATGMFQGDAMVWWGTSKDVREGIKTWEQFVKAVKDRFAPVNIKTNNLFTFKDIKQGERQSVADYISAFTSAMAFLPLKQVSEVMRIIQFINGLKEPLQSKMREEYEVDELTIDEVYKIVMRKDLMKNRGFSSSSSFYPSSSSSVNAISTSDQDEGEEEKMIVNKTEYLHFMQQNNSNNGRGYNNNNRPQYQGKDKLSDEERERRMKGGMCFTCNKTGHISRYCPQRKKNNNNRNDTSSSSSSSSSSNKFSKNYTARAQ